MKDLALKLDSVGVYVVTNKEFVQLNSNGQVIDTSGLALNAYVKSLKSKRDKRMKR